MSIVLICLAAFLTWFSYRRPMVLIALCAGLLWLGLAMYIFYAPVPIFDLAELHSQILVWVFFMMTFVPFLSLMDAEITVEKGGKRWTEWGEKPRKGSDSYEKYREELKRRIGGR